MNTLLSQQTCFLSVILYIKYRVIVHNRQELQSYSEIAIYLPRPQSCPSGRRTETSHCHGAVRSLLPGGGGNPGRSARFPGAPSSCVPNPSRLFRTKEPINCSNKCSNFYRTGCKSTSKLLLNKRDGTRSTVDG